MRRTLGVRIATLAFVVFVTTSPVFAANSRDDWPIGGIERAISRMMERIEKFLQPFDLDLPLISNPK